MINGDTVFFKRDVAAAGAGERGMIIGWQGPLALVSIDVGDGERATIAVELDDLTLGGGRYGRGRSARIGPRAQRR